MSNVAVNISASARPPALPDNPRRWSFLEEAEEQIGDAAQCFVWGAIGKTTRPIPKAPKLDSLGEANVRFIVGGSEHFLLLTDAGLCYSWGNGAFGALGHGDTMQRINPTLVEGLSSVHITQIAACRNHSAAVTDRGVLYHWGSLSSSSAVLGANSDLVTTPKTRTELKVMGNSIKAA